MTRIGKATTQGVVQQRVDQVQARGVDGKGITIGALSDSYDQASTSLLGGPLKVHARDDIKSGDLPGKGNEQYPEPVVVIEDTGPDGGADEGRAMLQIAHDIAPASKLCYATAFISEIGFANNIRRLADQQGACGADVIVDDVGYYDEPFFSDGIISDAVDDVTAQGAHYFSAAGNVGRGRVLGLGGQPRPCVQAGPPGHQPRLHRRRPRALRRRAAGHEPRFGHRRGPGRARR